MPAAARLLAACPVRADGYERQRPETTVLHEVVRESWPVFCARADEHGGLPKFVEREFDEYLTCGLLERGLLRLACEECGESMVVA